MSGSGDFGGAEFFAALCEGCESPYGQITREIDLYGATAHTFRHTFITMSSLFLDPKTLQSIAGHAKCDITMNRYAHAQQEQIAKAGEKLAGIYA